MIPADFDPDGAATTEQLYGLPVAADQALVRVIPVPFEATASFGKGTCGAPEAVRQASWQVDLFDLETGDAWRAGIALLPEDPDFARWNEEASRLAAPVIEAGGPGDDPALQAACEAVNRIGDAINQRVRAQAEAVFAAGAIPAVLGGDHSVPFGAIAAAAARHPGLGILHVDAHADLRDAYEGFAWSHASIFHNVLHRDLDVTVLSQIGIRDLGAAEWAMIRRDRRLRCATWPSLAEQLAAGARWLDLVAEVVEALPDEVWVSFDIDGLDPTLCPGTGTPVPGGLSWDQACQLLATLGRSGRRIVGFDLCEVGDQPWDANVGARLLYKMAGWAIRSNGR